jgi:Fe-S-cluster containining protein
LFRSMVGADGWCIHYDKPSRSCTIHNERPRFCRVEPETFKDLYGIEEKDMDKSACGWVPVPLLFHTSQDKNKIQTVNIYCTYPFHVCSS